MEASHSRATFIPPLRFEPSEDRHSMLQSPSPLLLREDQSVKAAGSETGTLDLLLSAGLVLARDDSSVGSGSAITALY